MKAGFIGWRGMVGSVLLERMLEENDFNNLESTFFSTSNAGGDAPAIPGAEKVLLDAYDLKKLSDHDVIISCQGGTYTKKVYGPLRESGWEGIWIDAASTLRMADDSVIILDPVNRHKIDEGLQNGIKTFVGGNCTVSLMLMALAGLFKNNLVEWLTSMTYQAASGGGAAHMKELISQSNHAGDSFSEAMTALEAERASRERLLSQSCPTDHFGHPLAYSLLPFIDTPVENGQSREEWKGITETNKILGLNPPIPIDGICVRVSSLRCHSQAFTIKLNQDLPLDEILGMISSANPWVEVIENEKDLSLKKLTPAAVTGTLQIPIGRIRKMNIGPEYLTAFTVGDQLLWGAAEPLRRMLKILKKEL